MPLSPEIPQEDTFRHRRSCRRAEESRQEHLATGEDYMLLLLLLLSCIDGSPPGSPVPGILQARTLEWVAISFSNA